jgi:hypothetical protein
MCYTSTKEVLFSNDSLNVLTPGMVGAILNTTNKSRITPDKVILLSDDDLTCNSPHFLSNLFNSPVLRETSNLSVLTPSMVGAILDTINKSTITPDKVILLSNDNLMCNSPHFLSNLLTLRF